MSCVYHGTTKARVCLGEFFILDSRLAMFWDETVFFGFLLVVFRLSASFFSFGVLERKVLGNCIDS